VTGDPSAPASGVAARARLERGGSAEGRSPSTEAGGLASDFDAADSVRGVEESPAPSAEPAAAVWVVGGVGRVMGVGIDVYEVAGVGGRVAVADASVAGVVAVVASSS
jgi:hypothetical protein